MTVGSFNGASWAVKFFHSHRTVSTKDLLNRKCHIFSHTDMVFESLTWQAGTHLTADIVTFCFSLMWNLRRHHNHFSVIALILERLVTRFIAFCGEANPWIYLWKVQSIIHFLGIVFCPGTTLLTPKDIDSRLFSSKADAIIIDEANMHKIQEVFI